jgi:hypothetical protein
MSKVEVWHASRVNLAGLAWAMEGTDRQDIAAKAVAAVEACLRRPGHVYAEQMTDRVDVWLERRGGSRRVYTLMA